MDRLVPQLGRVSAAPPAGAADINPLTAVKLWDNPCWLSFRLNFLALAFNGPVYEWVDTRFGLKRPDFMVLYSLFLKDGVAAKDICLSSNFPKNTVSRAVATLMRRQLVRRELDPADRRSFVLRLTPAGRAQVEDTMPTMLERERSLTATLSQAERHILFELLAKMVIDQARPADLAEVTSTQPTSHPEQGAISARHEERS